MFWLLRKMVFLAVLIGLGWFVMNYRVEGKTVKDYALEFYQSPLVQAAIEFGREKLGEKIAPYLKSEKPAAPETPDSLTDDDRKALDQLLQQKAGNR